MSHLIYDPSAPDFFRKAGGTVGPNGTADYTAPVTHNGFFGLGTTVDPISPLEFGDLVRNDVIRLWDGGIANPHQFYGLGVNSAVLRYQVDALGSAHGFYGAASATASKQYAKIGEREFTVGDPGAPVGEGHWTIGTLGAGDNGYIRFQSPTASPGNRIQAEISCDAISGNGGISGSSMSFKVANTVAGSTLKNAMHISPAGDVIISDPTTPYAETVAGNALLTVNGSIRVKGGVMVPTGGRQPGGLTFGTNNTSTLDFGFDTDGGITSLFDGNLTFYTNGAIGGALNAGGVWSKPGGGAWAATSDSRVKKNVTRTTGTLAKLLQLSPVRFQYNGQAGTPDGGVFYEGLMAQEVQKVFPNWVTETSEKIDGAPVLQVDSSPLVYALLEAVRELKAEIDKLKGVAVAAPVVNTATTTAPLSINMAKTAKLVAMDAPGLSAIGFTPVQSTMFLAGSGAIKMGLASGMAEADALKLLSGLLTSIGLTLSGVLAKL